MVITNQEEAVQAVIVSVHLCLYLLVQHIKLQSVVVELDLTIVPGAEIEEVQELLLHLTHAP